MVKTSHREHANEVEQRSGENRNFAPADKKHTKAAGMKKEKRQASAKIEIILSRTNAFHALGEIICIEPLPERSQRSRDEFCNF